MKLSVVIPVYNERETIDPILDRVLAVPLTKEIVVVDDGSTDGTSRILEARPLQEILLLRHSENRGKGAAIRTALAHVTGDVILVQDADLEYSPEDYPRLLQPIVDGEASVVFGSRILGNPRFYSMGPVNFHKAGYFRNPLITVAFYYGGRLVTLLTNVLYRAHLTDQPTCYKVFRREVLHDIRLSCDGFEFCSEFTAKALRAGYRIAEVPVAYTPRGVSEGKKLSWRDGLRAVSTLLRIRFNR